MGDLSRHFSKWEMACPHCGACVIHSSLLVMVEKLRANAGGRPLRIVSGFRCAEYNRRVGGAPRSQHPRGRAADIPPGYATVAQAARAGAVGIGSSGRWAIHVDTRPGSPARWKY